MQYRSLFLDVEPAAARAAGLSSRHRLIEGPLLGERRNAFGLGEVDAEQVAAGGVVQDHCGRVAHSLQRRIATGPQLLPGLRPISRNCLRVTSPSGAMLRSYSGSAASLRGTRFTSRRRRFFRGRGITCSRRWAGGRGGAGSGGRGAAGGAGRSGGAGGG
ncbi:hypothetical protein BGK67_34005 [Streptomyces subrutilus]|uniref:Uncharacterized protein n=1 Tax=Streptomyces subrutilus TaxID=36818 RepID=A0A1E5P0J1_9ACTN|nr:hypothetical protein BGK67_34005 [Streptomyces subrutilus]